MIRHVAVMPLLSLEILMLTIAPVANRPEPDARVAAFLFSYDVKPGLQAQFEDGYARHLEWHRNAGDPLRWYGWYVSTGPNIGRFVDGTFGLTFEEFDRRVDPAGDRQDGERNMMPFVEPVERTVWRMRPDLGAEAFLERGGRAPLLEVRTYSVRPGAEGIFEEAIRSYASAASEDGLAATWYQLVVGGDAPTYLQLKPRHVFAGFQAALPEPETGDSVERIQAETWSYVERLSYFPPRAEGEKEPAE